MTLPLLEIVDKQGNPLPYLSDDPEVQYTKQYDGEWFVRVIGNWDGKVALISKHDSPLPMKPVDGRSDRWRIPYDKEHVRELSANQKKWHKETSPASGRLRIGLVDDENKIIPGTLIRQLDVFPGNISPKQLSQMVDEIGMLALSATSRAINDKPIVPVGENQGLSYRGSKWNAHHDGSLLSPPAIQKFVKVLQREIPRLRARPLRSVIAEVGPTRVDKALSKSFSSQRIRETNGRRTIFALTKTESLDCTENQYILSVLHRLKVIIPCVIKNLEVELLPIPPFSYRDIGTLRTNQSQFFAEVNRRQEQGKNEFDELSQERKKVAEELDKCLQWVNRERNHVFWSNVVFVTNPKISLRLTGSPAYAAICTHFQGLWGDTQVQLEQVYSLLIYLQQGYLRRVWEIYELWCFIRLYIALTHEFRGLVPIGDDLFQQLSFENGELHLPKNTPFTLVGKLPDNTPLQFRLWYEPALQNRAGINRMPDILLELCTQRTRKIYFIFDSKYRNYHKQSETELVNDVYGVARAKYLESGLRFQNSEQELDIKASFILHTSEDIDYWGEVPVHQFVGINFGDKATSQLYNIEETDKIIRYNQYLDKNDYAGHKYGAISFCIGHPKRPEHQFRRLVYLLMYFFAGEMRFCPHCGVEAKYAEDGDEVQGQGVYYSCPSCGRFWVDHFCAANRQHRIIKLGEDSFHKPVDSGSKRWMYICPQCGNLGGPAKKQRSGSRQSTPLWEV